MKMHQGWVPILLTAAILGAGCSETYAQVTAAENCWSAPAPYQAGYSRSPAPWAQSGVSAAQPSGGYSSQPGGYSASGFTGGSLYQQSVLEGATNAFVSTPQNSGYATSLQNSGCATTTFGAAPNSYGNGATVVSSNGGAACGPGNAGWEAGYVQSPPSQSVFVATPAAVWFASANALFMSRTGGHHYRFSFGTNNEALQLVDVRDANMDLTGGFETRVGRSFNCGQNAIEVGYWGLFPGTEQSLVYGHQASGNLNAILNFDQLNYNGNTADFWANNGAAHRVSRDMTFYNVEINFVRFSQTPCSGWSFEWRTGPQYFHYGEDLEFAADNTDTNFTGAANELYYNVDVTNHLIGWSLSGSGRRQLTQRLSTKLSVGGGLFANYVEHQSRIGGSAGDAVINNGPFVNRAFNVSSSNTSGAFLGQIDLRFDYQINCRWTLFAGSRLLAISGVALPADQIYHDLRGINDVAEIESDGSLMLFGGYAGIQSCF